MMDLSSYAFSVLREGELTLYRGSADGLDPILLVAWTTAIDGAMLGVASASVKRGR